MDRDLRTAERTMARASTMNDFTLGGITPIAQGTPHGRGDWTEAGAHTEPRLFQGSAMGAPDIDHFHTIVPFNAEVTKQFLAGLGDDGGHGPVPMASGSGAMDLGTEKLTQLQLDTAEYVENLDSMLRHLYQQPNAKLSRRLRETSEVPLTFMYFRVQQQMLKMTGDLSIEKERQMLNKLALMLEA